MFRISDIIYTSVIGSPALVVGFNESDNNFTFNIRIPSKNSFVYSETKFSSIEDFINIIYLLCRNCSMNEEILYTSNTCPDFYFRKTGKKVIIAIADGKDFTLNFDEFIHHEFINIFQQKVVKNNSCIIVGNFACRISYRIGNLHLVMTNVDDLDWVRGLYFNKGIIMSGISEEVKKKAEKLINECKI